MRWFCIAAIMFFGPVLVADAAELATDWPTDEVLSKARPGDAVRVADGIYRDAPVQLTLRGEEGRPIVIRPETPGGVILNGTSSITFLECADVVLDGFVFDQAWGRKVVRLEGCRRVRITNCAFIESGCAESTFPRIVEITDGSRHCRADHLFMRGNLSMGVGCPYGRDTPPDKVNTHNRFDHIWFKDIVRRRGNGQEAVFLGGGMTDTPHHATVEYNLFDNASGDAEAISNKSGYNTLRYNTFRNCKAALVLRGGRNVRVEGNYFFNMSPGLRIYGTQHTILNNHLQNCTVGIMMPTGTNYEVAYYNTFYQGLSDSVIANNTIVNCGPAAFHMGRGYGTNAKASEAWKRKRNWDGNTTYDKPPKNNRFVRNLVVGDDIAFLEKIAGVNNAWQENVWSQKADGADISQTDLDRIGARAVTLGLTEEHGVLKPQQDTIAKVGCDYSIVGGVFGRPLTPKDVGPNWMNGDPKRVKRIPNPKTPPAK